MTSEVAADAGPLIGLARAGLLGLLPALYPAIEVPPAVEGELRLGEDRPGSRALQEAQAAGWLVTVALINPKQATEIAQTVDRGEAEAIVLAEERDSRFLLVDERRARALARRRGIPIVGTGGILIVAKERGLLPRIGGALDRLAGAGYRLSPRVCEEILRRAGE